MLIHRAISLHNQLVQATSCWRIISPSSDSCCGVKSSREESKGGACNGGQVDCASALETRTQRMAMRRVQRMRFAPGCFGVEINTGRSSQQPNPAQDCGACRFGKPEVAPQDLRAWDPSPKLYP